ncbi:MAG TPA: hypothetical protein VGR49_04815 [Actinomycetota bacterium]|nr:hypothetical protein [Actinomycetota bacterium]
MISLAGPPIDRARSLTKLWLVVAVSLAACGQGEEVRAWCRSFESATTAFVDVYERVPEGTDPAKAFAEDPELAADAREAGRKMRALIAKDPPEEIEDDFRLITTTLPPDPAQSSAEEEGRYDDALRDVKAFVESDCNLDPELIEQLNRTG